MHCIGRMVDGACTSDFISVGWCCGVDIAPQTAAIETSRGDYLALCVPYKRRLAGALGWPWLGRERAKKIGRFVAPWLFDFEDLGVLGR